MQIAVHFLLKMHSLFLDAAVKAPFLKKCQEAGTVCPDELVLPGMVPFPEGFSLKVIREEIQNLASNERLYGRMPEITNCTNAWTEGKGLADICKNTGERGTDSRFFYNCFIQINGVEDKLLYVYEHR